MDLFALGKRKASLYGKVFYFPKEKTLVSREDTKLKFASLSIMYSRSTEVLFISFLPEKQKLFWAT